MSNPHKIQLIVSARAGAGVVPVLAFFDDISIVPTEVDLAAGEQVDFVFQPPGSRKYTIATKGASDTLLGLFEEVGEHPRYLTADDDSGDDRNASITYKLLTGRTYHIRLRLYYPGQSGTTSLMIS